MWDNLSLSEKAQLMRIFVSNKITSLDEMKKQYNQYAEGGEMEEDGIPSYQPSNALGEEYRGVYTQIVNHPTYPQRLQREMFGDKELESEEKQMLDEEYAFRKNQVATIAASVSEYPLTEELGGVYVLPKEEKPGYINSGKGSALHEFSHAAENAGKYRLSFAEDGFSKAVKQTNAAKDFYISQEDSEKEKAIREKYYSQLKQFLKTADLPEEEKKRYLSNQDPIHVIYQNFQSQIPIEKPDLELHMNNLEKNVKYNRYREYYGQPTEIKARLNQLRGEAFQKYEYDYNKDFNINDYEELKQHRQYNALIEGVGFTDEDINEMMKYVASINQPKNSIQGNIFINPNRYNV